MAKLYWRIKKNGKWTWTPARTYEWAQMTVVEDLGDEEE